LLAVATLGAGFVSAEPLYLIAGAAAYVVGWVFVPDLPLFRRYLERKGAAAQAVAEKGEVAQFQARRDALIAGLTPVRRERYFDLAQVCRDIEAATVEQPDDPRLRKIEELMWTFLRLLTIEESLAEFLDSEARDDVPAQLAAARDEVARLEARGADDRLLASRREVAETLAKRADRLATAQSNLALVVSEQERLDQQIKLIRADSVATRNAAALSARIDATVEHLEHTNQWLAQMDQFRDLVADVPFTTQRTGFGEKPPVSAPPKQRGKERA
jgi:hypothetical protein